MTWKMKAEISTSVHLWSANRKKGQKWEYNNQDVSKIANVRPQNKEDSRVAKKINQKLRVRNILVHSRIFRPRRNLGNIHYSESRRKSDRHQVSWKKHRIQEDNRVPTVWKENSLAPRIQYPGKPLFKCADKMTISTAYETSEKLTLHLPFVK